MNPFASIGLAGLLLLLSSGPSLADCVDHPEPGVVWRRCYVDGRDLRGVNLSGARLDESSFQRAILAGGDLTGVQAYRVKFISADLTGAKLDGGLFSEGDFTKAEMSGASLKGADLRRARLFRANLRGANLTGAKIAGADLLHVDLSGATWIDGQRTCLEGSLGQCN